MPGVSATPLSMAHYWPTQPAPGPLGPSYDTVEPCIDLILVRKAWGDGMQDGIPEIVSRFRGLMSKICVGSWIVSQHVTT